MATRKDDFVTIASIIKREIQKRKKQKKSKNELINCVPISNASAEDETELILFKKKKKKKKRDKKMLQNDENMNNHIGTLEVDEFYTETHDENNKHLIKDKTLYSNLSKDEFTRNINISKISEGDSLFKKKKKKKKRDKKMLQNDENMNNHIGTLEVDEFYTETRDENNKHLIKDKTLYSNLSKDEFSRNINISKISEGDSLFKKKKKKKKRDKKMLQNDENMNNHIGTLEVDEFFTETCDENNKHLIKDKTLYSNLNKDEFSRNINISKISEGDSLFKKKKKKKKGDKIMVQNDNNFKNDVGTLKEDEFYTENCDENNKDLYLDETMDSNFSKDEFTRSISITNDSEGDLLFKKKKKKKRDKKMVQIDKYLKNDKATLKVQQFYNDTCNDKIKYLNKINISGSNLNRDNSTTSIQIANASEDDEELTLLKSPLKKSKLKKKKSKAKKEDTESSKYESIQKNFKNVEDLKKCISEEQSNEIHNGKICILQISSEINVLETAMTAY
ncbi:unnamed protein product [Macrosiphum euphorbiae]|uniref:Uncharacterized protein n=1 Tax=Macrosiphum euphorbiae TaxID=13131 RepID=A0AAV0XG28_9HEMI|nr:unnamed protein product [Macrosiphum euphorbiae]